jgi:hypothetical protein
VCTAGASDPQAGLVAGAPVCALRSNPSINTLRLVPAAVFCAVQVPALQQLNMYGCRRASGTQLQVVLDKLAALQWISLNGCYGITTLHLTRKRSQVPAAHQQLVCHLVPVVLRRVASDLILRTWDSVWVSVLGWECMFPDADSRLCVLAQLSCNLQATLSCRVWTCQAAASCQRSAVPALSYSS